MRYARQNIARNIPGTQNFALTASGLEYYLEWETEILVAGTTAQAVFTTPATKYVILNFRQLYFDQERGFYRVWTGFTGGTPGAALSGVPVRQDSTVAPAMTAALHSGADTSGANRILNVPLFGASGGLLEPATGDTESADDIRILSPNSSFLVEQVNASANDSYFQVALKWYEVLPSFMPEITEI